MIINHENALYKAIRAGSMYNGAYYYSVEICKNIIPNIKTNRNWVTINIPPIGKDNSIVFIHNNKNPERYEWLRRYRDVVCVCGIPETVERVKHIGKAIYLPLSVDVKEVEAYKRKKTKDTAFVGRSAKKKDLALPPDIDFIEDMPRELLLKEMAKYKNIYAVGRTAIEGMILGCKILPYDPRFPDPSIWKVLDNSEAVPILQRELEKIDS